MFKRFEIFGTSPLDIKNLNENFKALWLKVFGNLSIGDLNSDSQQVINTAYKKSIQTEQKLNETTTRVTNIETNVNTIQGELTTKVSQTEFNSLNQRVSTAESTITQQANEISLRVRKDSIISAINLTPETAVINANKINLNGAVTFSSLSSDLQTTVNNGVITNIIVNSWKYPGKTTINGANIETGTITADKIKAGELVVGKNVTMGQNAYISWNNIIGKPPIPNGTYIDANGLYTGTIACDKITSYSSDPIIRLFNQGDSYCSIDATAYNEQGKGNAIRLKWNRDTYFLIGEPSFYSDGYASIYLKKSGYSTECYHFGTEQLILPNSCSIDCASGILRLKYSNSTYISVKSSGLILYVDGTEIFTVNNGGIYFKGNKIR